MDSARGAWKHPGVRRTPALLTGLPLLAAVLWAASAVCPTLLREAREAVAGDALPALRTAAGALALRACLGRALLAWLPAGRPGGHGLVELAATWGASHMIGSAALAPFPGAPPAAIWVAAGVLAALRLATLPAPMLPGPLPGARRADALSRAATVALVLVAALMIVAAATTAEQVRAAADGIALAALGAHALERHDRGPSTRRAIALLLLLTFPLVPRVAGPQGASLALFLVGAASAFAIRLRAADRRAFAIVIFAAAGAATVLVTLLKQDPPPSLPAAVLPLFPAGLLLLGLWAVPARTPPPPSLR